MATTDLVNLPINVNRIGAKLRDYYTLTKPEVNLLILMTTSAGFVLGHVGSLHWYGLLNTVLGTLLVASGSETLNQFMERQYDAEMRRTANRPVTAGPVSARAALAFGLRVSAVGGG